MPFSVGYTLPYDRSGVIFSLSQVQNFLAMSGTAAPFKPPKHWWPKWGISSPFETKKEGWGWRRFLKACISRNGLTENDENTWNYPKSRFSMFKHGLSYKFEEKLLFCRFFDFFINRKWWKYLKLPKIAFFHV
jgi:hypothetical protein